MLLAACDPGLRNCGVSVWADGRLVWAALVRNPEQVVRGQRAWAAMAAAVRDAVPLDLDLFVVEAPQFDARTKDAAADVLELTGVVNALLIAFAGSAARFEAPTPSRWKGQVPKTVTTNRTLAALSPEELANVCFAAPGLMHNVWDGVALGRWATRTLTVPK